MSDGVGPVAVPTRLLGEVIDLDHQPVTQRVEAGTLVAAVLDLIDLRSQLVGLGCGERLSIPAHGQPAGDCRRHDLGGQSDHLLQDGVDLRRLHQQTQKLAVSGGQNRRAGRMGHGHRLS